MWVARSPAAIRQVKRNAAAIPSVHLHGKQRTLEFDEERALMAETQKATVVFGVLNETSEDETRVALTPDIVTRLQKSGVPA